MLHLTTDIRMAWRATMARPWFAGSLALVIALGVGLNTAAFSAVDSILVRPLPFHDPEQLVVVWGMQPQIGKEEASVPDFLDWKTQSTSFQRLSASSNSRETIGRPGQEPERVRAARVMPDYFSTLGARVALGRDFVPGDFVYGSHRVAILSDALWRQRFGADPGVVGSGLTVNGATFTVIGIAQEGFALPPEARMWTPLALDPAAGAPGRRNDFLLVVGRLRPEVTATRAQQELVGIMKRLEAEYPASNAGWTAVVEPMRETLVAGARDALRVFMAVVAIVLLVACANVANLLLARGVAREREMSVREMLGAGRGRLVLQLVLENLMIAVAGGIGGSAIAVWGVELLKKLAPAGTPRLDEVGIHGRALFFAFGISLITGLLFGLAPAWRLARAARRGLLVSGGSTRSATAGRGAARLRTVLVSAQIAMAALLLVAGGLLLKSFQEMQRVAVGFSPERLLTAQLPLPRERYRDLGKAYALFEQIAERLRATPGVETVGLTSDLPMAGGGGFNSFVVEGRAPLPNDVVQDANLVVTDAAYLRVMGIPLHEGRGLTSQDKDGAPPVGLANRALVRKYFPRESALGHRLSFDGTTWVTIVGITGDVRLESPVSEPYPAVTVPLAQQPQRTMSVVLRTAGEPGSLLPSLRRVVFQLEPDVPVYDAATMDARLTRALAAPRTASWLAGVFAALVVLLALAGLYGVISYAVAQRTRELGVRMALGATRRDVMSLVLRQGLTPAAAGVVTGLLLCVALTRSLSTLLFGVRPIDAPTFAVAGLLLLMLGVLATFRPARAAARLNPVTALRLD